MTDLSREARALLEAAADADDPSLADKARVHDALMARIAAAPAAPAAAAPTATATAGMSLALKLVIALAVVGGLSVGTYLVTRDTEPPAITKLETPAPEPVPAIEPEPAPAIEPEPAAAIEPEPAAAIEPEPASSNAARRPAKPSAAPDLESLVAEKRLLSAARRALDESRAGAALALCDEHQRRFPRGQLAAEREGTRVLALCELDRRADAITRAGRFLRAYPRHPMVARVRGSCAFAQ